MRVRISLLPERYKPQKQLRFVVVFVYILFFMLLVGIVFIEQNLSFKIKEKQDEVESIKSSLAMFGEKRAQTENLKKQLAKIDEYLAVKAKIIQGTLDPTAILENVKEIIPVDVWITRFRVDANGAVTIGFSTYSLNGVANTIIMFSRSPFFNKDSVSVSGINSSKSGDNQVFSFEMKTSLRIRRGDEIAKTGAG